MSTLPTIVIALADYKTNINLVWEAMGRGPDNLSRKMCTIDPEATWETPPTHYMMNDMSATDEMVADWQGLCSGDLPPIEGQWGEAGVITSLDAQTACSGGHMQVFSAAGLADPQDTDPDAITPIRWRDGIFSGVGLQFVPDPPL